MALAVPFRKRFVVALPPRGADILAETIRVDDFQIAISPQLWLADTIVVNSIVKFPCALIVPIDSLSCLASSKN